MSGSGSANPTTYRPDIDGLRAVAVVAVVLFHAKVHLVSGGYVGVDIFFVISGYLITSILAADRRAGRLSIAAFYNRRIRRIFPALFVMAALCTAVAALTFPPTDFAAFGRSLIAMALFSSNVYFEATREAAGYFDVASQTQLLLHTWSLAVEEQFYILLPLALLLLRRCGDHVIVRILAIVAALSFAFSVWAVVAWPADAFYDVVSRAWELLLGSLLALRAPPALTTRRTRETAAGLGFALIAYAILGFSERTPFPGAAALLPCVGTALLIHAGASGPTLVGRALSSRIAVAIGLVSYSLYLWHWPIIVMVRYASAGLMEAPQIVVALVLSFVAAALSYRFVETPFRRGGPQLPRRAIIATGLGVSLVASLAGTWIAVGDGLPGRFDPAALERVAANARRTGEVPSPECQNYGAAVRSARDFTFCAIGPAAPRKILVWGDSHADGLRPLLHQLYDEKALGGHSVVVAAAAGCPPAMTLAPVHAPQCALYAQWSLARADAPDVDTVLVAFAPWWERYDNILCRSADGGCGERLSRSAAEDLFVGDLRASLERLTADGKQVVLALPAPAYNVSIPRLETNAATLPTLDRLARATGLLRFVRYDYRTLRQRLQALADDLRIATFDPRDSLCRGDDCRYAQDGVSLYVDSDHLATSQLGLFHDDLKVLLRSPSHGSHVATQTAP